MGIEAVQKNDASMYQGSTSAQAVEKTSAEQAPVYAKEIKTPGQKGGTTSAQDVLNSKTKGANAFGDSEQLKNAVSDLNKKMGNSEAVFGIHEKTNRVVIKIVDKESKKVMKEYPAEETLDMIAKVWEAAGLMVDEKR